MSTPLLPPGAIAPWLRTARPGTDRYPKVCTLCGWAGVVSMRAQACVLMCNLCKLRARSTGRAGVEGRRGVYVCRRGVPCESRGEWLRCKLRQGGHIGLAKIAPEWRQEPPAPSAGRGCTHVQGRPHTHCGTHPTRSAGEPPRAAASIHPPSPVLRLALIPSLPRRPPARWAAALTGTPIGLADGRTTAQTAKGRRAAARRRGRLGETSPGADVAGLSAVRMARRT